MIEKKDHRYVVVVPMLIANAQGLLQAGRVLLGSETAVEVTIDLDQVNDADSSALGVLFGLLRTAEKCGKRISVANPPPGLISLAALYGVSDALPLA
jgi:phospholipid transport system transporter-binding protein